MDVDNITHLLGNANIGPTVSDSFIQELHYICNTVINVYNQNGYIYIDVLDILSHLGHELAYDVSETFEIDCRWFYQYGKVYVYNYILTRIQLQNYQEYLDIDTLINRIKDVYDI